jgi:hypothetical protein
MTYLALIKEHLYLFYIDINTQALIPIKDICDQDERCNIRCGGMEGIRM